VNTTKTSAADGTKDPNITGSPALTGARHPLYRLRESDTVEIKFTFSPEFDQTLTVLPDGFVSLKAAADTYAEGLTILELQDSVRSAYAPILRDPDVSVILSGFEHPFFVAGGQVGRPGKYELRSPTSVAEAIAIAGGFTEQAKHSQVVLFRKVSDGVVETHVLNVKAMLAARNLEEDLELKPGDLLFVPQNRISKIRKYLPVASLSTFFTPAQF
jgi:polysaccharide export outer membrane protein